MRTSGLLMLSAAPGVALGYFLLTGYLLNRIKPLPITRMPWPKAESETKKTRVAVIA